MSNKNRRQHIPRKLRHKVFQRDGYRCRECGATNKETTLHIDHIIPVSKGGTNTEDNLQTLCEACNLAKYTDAWVGGVQGNKNYMGETFNDLYELNKKQREINLSKHLNKQKRRSSSNDLYRLNKKQREINLSKHLNKQKRGSSSFNSVNGYKKVDNIFDESNELNPVCSKIIREFKLCNDINIVSKKVGVPAIEIKRWYRKGKRGDPTYEDFYKILLNINPNMDIKNFDYRTINDNNNFKTNNNIGRFENCPIEEQFDMIVNKFTEGCSIRDVSKIFKLPSNKISDWYFKGKNSNCKYTEFYHRINNLTPNIASKIERDNKKRMSKGKFNQIINENLDELCRIYSIPKLGKTYVTNWLINNYEVEDIIAELDKYSNEDYSNLNSVKNTSNKKNKKSTECAEVDYKKKRRTIKKIFQWKQ